MNVSIQPRMTLANRITIARIMALPFFVAMLVYYTIGLSVGQPNEIYRYVAQALFVVVAGTDALDGYFARSRNEITELGRILDPLADKALLLSGLILLTRPSLPGLVPHIPVWFTVLVISRDAVLVAGYMVIHHVAGRVKVRPRVVGKIATFFTMLAVVWVLFRGQAGLFLVVVWIAAFFVAISWIAYFVDGLRQLEKHGSVAGPNARVL